MEVNHRQTTTVTLVLNEKEAQWLNGVMQNPLRDQTPLTESEEDSSMRIKFFEATKNIS